MYSSYDVSSSQTVICQRCVRIHDLIAATDAYHLSKTNVIQLFVICVAIV